MNYRRLGALAAGGLIILAARPAEAQNEWSFEGDRLLVTNLIGEVTVRGHDGSRIIVRAQPGGDDANMLDFQVKQGGRAEFHVVYPFRESLSYSYPNRRGGSTETRVENWVDESSFMEDLYSGVSGRDRIKIRGSGDLEAWADLEILVPRGVESRIVVAVGEIRASNVEAALDLDTHSGPVSAENIRGSTNIDTGSGSVVAKSITGNLTIDTGSGSVEAADVEGDDVRIDTGSGRVTADRIRGRDLEIDTGSGSVRTTEIYTTSSLIDTGSGSVTLDLMQLGEGRHVIDTGSGSVTITMPADASVRITADTGSGGIDLDIPNAMLRRVSRDHIELEIGGGDATMEIDTGSGGITIKTR
jgi:hypothetical protein